MSKPKKKEPNETLRERLSTIVPPEILDKMTPEQLADALIDTPQPKLPDSVKQRVLDTLEERAKEAGFADLDDYLDSHPDGIALWTDPIHFEITEAERAEMDATAALENQDADPIGQIQQEAYDVHVILFSIINVCADEPVTVDRDVMSGKPCVRSTRVPIDMILAQLAKKRPDGQYCNIDDVVAAHSDLLDYEQVEAALKYAAQCLRPQAFAEAVTLLAEVASEDDMYDEDENENEDEDNNPGLA